MFTLTITLGFMWLTPQRNYRVLHVPPFFITMGFICSPETINMGFIWLTRNHTGFLQRAQCSHCKCCISYSNSVCPSVCLSVRPSGQRSRNVLAAITRQRMVVSTSNLVETVIARCASRDTLSRSVGQLERK